MQDDSPAFVAGVVALASAALATLTYGVFRMFTRAPRGKGVFVRSVKHADMPAEMAALCKVMGLSWVTIGYIWQNPDGSSKRYHVKDIPRYVRELRRHGIACWLWAWPEPGRAREVADLYKWIADRCKLEGLMMDPEAPYQGASPEVTRQDVKILRGLGVRLGCTTYGGPPSWHPRFPWKEWAACDFGMPQLYDTQHKWGAEHQRRTFDGWREVGFRILVPIWGASNAHSPAQMAEEIRQTPAEYKGCAWWDYYWLELSRARREVVRKFKIGGRAVA